MSNPTSSSAPAVPVIPETHTLSIPSMPPPPPPPPVQLSNLNSPRLDLLEGTREDYINDRNKLYEAALKGDWKAAKPILDKRPDVVRFAITEHHDTLLHIAAREKSTKAVEVFVKNLVHLMEEDDLKLQNKNGDTALNSTARAGNVEIAKTMVEKNVGLNVIQNKQGQTALYIAALFAYPEMVRYLYDKSTNMSGVYWTYRNRRLVLEYCVEAEIFDVVLKIVNDRSELNEKKSLHMDVLLALAKNTKAFEGKQTTSVFRRFTSRFWINVEPSVEVSEGQQLLRTIWGKIAKLDKVEIDSILRGNPVKVEKENTEMESEVMPILRKILEKMDRGLLKREIEMENEVKTKMAITVTTYPSRLLFVAAKAGNTRFITEIIRLYPDVAWEVDDKGKTIFHLAIKRRQAEIYNLLHEIVAMNDTITCIKDNKGNTMMHMVAKSAKHQKFQNVSGAALHIQSGLLWFEEVKKNTPLMYRKRKNIYGETPQDLFGKTHELLITKCEKWMKSYLVVATLIATIVFAAAFTVPGGYNQINGIPYFRNKPSFVIFVISDAISLISSSTSILTLLYILTSSYTEIESLKSLPEKLMLAVATLFLSIMTMMIAFCASFFILYTGKHKWVPITITLLAGVPVILFTYLQLQLAAYAYVENRSRSLLFKNSKRVL